MTRQWLGLVLLMFLCASAHAQRLTRGPYLQMITPESVVLRWRTDKLATNYVRYGEEVAKLTSVAFNEGLLREHAVMISGLKPNTRYYYAVGLPDKILARGTNFYFITAPPPGAAQPIRVWVLGDSGTRTGNQKAVRDAYYRATGARHTDAILMLGDNAYSFGTDHEYQGAVFEMYSAILRNTVLWPTLGNHDARSCNSATQTGVYYDIFTMPTLGEAGGVLSGTKAYYSFD